MYPVTIRNAPSPDPTGIDDVVLVEARARWVSLSPARQMSVARCLALCRQADFTRSVRQVVTVTAGLRRRNDEEGVEYLHNEPCVVFIVRRKMTEGQLARSPSQRLPRELLAPAWIDGREQVVSVPTDVQTQSRLEGAGAQALTSVSVDCTDGWWARGVLAWAVSVGGQRYALAPMHVLTPCLSPDGMGGHVGARVGLGQPLAASTGFGGRVVPLEEGMSFDVQLAKLLRPAAFSALFGGLRLSAERPWARSEEEFDQLLGDGLSLEIFAPADNPDRTDGGVPPFPAERSIVEREWELTYQFADGSKRKIKHRVLELQVRFGKCTFSGDSGCPVLLRDADDQFTLVGMHIAGDVDRGQSYVVPIWRLLDPRSYADVGGSLPDGTLDLVTSP
ncbi:MULTISPECIES: hypothetical protein [unclassified Delftia]|uniref:hypothetical protein n=1 Tax=unclassified Delftia TaxID=2613839 RepID=UPI001900642D|nr:MULTISPECIES: hypothetical protein [unclassified Delftia]MBK0115442.1 hypothetical protein [Delftia sp. S65]MBK0121700.1 hypothetical protein [Delftia sp. S67]MBK0133548.1 hypothetical protein [Delftia sp. S66]